MPNCAGLAMCWGWMMTISLSTYCLVSIMREGGPLGARRNSLRTLWRPHSKTSSLILTWENMALDRTSWQNALHCGAASYESQWTRHAIMKRAVHKAKAACALPDSVNHVCSHSGRLIHAHICLVSHLHSHQSWITMWCCGLLPLGWKNTHFIMLWCYNINTFWHDVIKLWHHYLHYDIIMLWCFTLLFDAVILWYHYIMMLGYFIIYYDVITSLHYDTVTLHYTGIALWHC